MDLDFGAHAHRAVSVSHFVARPAAIRDGEAVHDL